VGLVGTDRQPGDQCADALSQLGELTGPVLGFVDDDHQVQRFATQLCKAHTPEQTPEA